MNKEIRVLFVEDEEKDVLLAVRELERGGFKVASKRVDTAESMAASLAQENFDIIFSDHTMPRFSAPAALQIIKQSGINLPFILVSGTLRTQVAVDIMRAGAQDYVDKGDLSRLVAIVEREMREVEKKVEAMKSLTLSQEHFEILANTSTDWIYWINLGNKLIYVSPSVYQITGYRPKDFIDDPELMMKIIHPGDKEWFLKHISEYHTSPGMYHESESEFRIIHEDGSVRWVSHKCGPIIDTNNELLGRHISNRDITRRKAAEFELEKKTSEAIASEQKARIYFDFLAHDIANILSPMMVYADIIKLAPNDQATVQKFITKTYDQTKRAAALICNLRRLEAADNLHPNEMDAMDLRTLFSAMEDNIRSEFSDRVIEISYDFPDVESISVKGGEWLQDAFHHIFDNAVRYSVRSPVKLDIRVSAQQNDNEKHWQIEISDNGPGISNNLKKAYSNSIINSETKFRGVASSIPFCISFIKCIGGKMLIEDRLPGDPGQGTRITIMLPRGE